MSQYLTSRENASQVRPSSSFRCSWLTDMSSRIFIQKLGSESLGSRRGGGQNEGHGFSKRGTTSFRGMPQSAHRPDGLKLCPLVLVMTYYATAINHRPSHTECCCAAIFGLALSHFSTFQPEPLAQKATEIQGSNGKMRTPCLGKAVCVCVCNPQYLNAEQRLHPHPRGRTFPIGPAQPQVPMALQQATNNQLLDRRHAASCSKKQETRHTKTGVATLL